jgi:hypothetical protein
LPDRAEEETAPFIPPALVPARVNRHSVVKWVAIVIAIFSILYVGSKAWQSFGPRFGGATTAHGEPLVTQQVNDVTVKIFGDPRSGQSDLLIEFRDAAGELVDVGNVRLDMTMNMPGMTMRDSGKIQPAGKPGQYRVRVSPSMAGDWTTNLSYDGPRGHGETVISLSVNANK